MIKIKLTLTICLLSLLGLQAQETISSRLFDAESFEPIGYVNIGVLETSSGTVSDEDGKFSIKVENSNAMIKLSSIGYHDKTISAQDLRKMDTIYMAPQDYVIAVVEVKSKKLNEEQKYGRYIKPGSTIWGWTDSEKLGLEIGMRIKFKKPTYLKSAHFAVHRASTDSLLLRVNVYEFKKGKLGKNLLPENVFIRTDANADFLNINLSKYNLIVDHDVLLTLETVQKVQYAERTFVAFRVKTSLFSQNVYRRDVKHAEFRKEKGVKMMRENIGFYFIGREVE